MANPSLSKTILLAVIPFAMSLGFSVSPLRAQELFKCVGNDGRTTYQAVPCNSADKRGAIKQSAGGPEVVSPAPTPTKAVSAMGTPGAPAPTDAQKLKGLQMSRRSNELRADIENAQSNISLFRSQMEREMSMLRDRKNYSNNNLAGATWEQSISTEMQAVATSYETKIKIEQSKVRQIQSQLSDLEKQKP